MVLPLDISTVEVDIVAQSSPETNLWRTKVTEPEAPLFLASRDRDTASPGLGVGFDHSHVVSAALKLMSGPVKARGQDASGSSTVFPILS